jgi:hypothetical protein
VKKTYCDFVSDVADDSDLYNALCRAIPFSDATAVSTWFADHGYTVAGADAEQLLVHQNAVTPDDAPINY